MIIYYIRYYKTLSKINCSKMREKFERLRKVTKKRMEKEKRTLICRQIPSFVFLYQALNMMQHTQLLKSTSSLWMTVLGQYTLIFSVCIAPCYGYLRNNLQTLKLCFNRLAALLFYWSSTFSLSHLSRSLIQFASQSHISQRIHQSYWES